MTSVTSKAKWKNEMAWARLTKSLRTMVLSCPESRLSWSGTYTHKHQGEISAFWISTAIFEHPNKFKHTFSHDLYQNVFRCGKMLNWFKILKSCSKCFHLTLCVHRPLLFDTTSLSLSFNSLKDHDLSQRGRSSAMSYGGNRPQIK